MITKKFLVEVENGLHAREALKLMQLSEKFQAKITLSKENETVATDSIIDILTLSAEHGASVEVSAEGEDEVEAMNACALFFKGQS